MIKYVFYLIPLLGGMLLFCGCPSDASKQNKETLTQLKEINAALKVLAAPKSTETETVNVPSLSVEEILAAVKPLPPQPTDAQITAYIDSVIAATGDWMISGRYDPRTEYLRKIGPGHFSVLVPYFEGGEGLSIRDLWADALPDLVVDSDKAMVIKLLPHSPALTEVVAKNGWEKDAKAEFFKLAWCSDFIPYQLKQTLRTFVTTPEDRQELTKLFLEKPGCDNFYPLVSSFAGADPKALALAAWEKHRYGGDVNQFGRAVRAASFGSREALNSAISLYLAERNLAGYDETTILLAQTTGQVLNRKILYQWYQANKDKLVFNAETRRFEVK